MLLAESDNIGVFFVCFNIVENYFLGWVGL